MTDSGTFVINGAERVEVSQLVRSPGCYYAEEFDTKTGKKTYTSTIMPLRGAWLEYETDSNDIIYVRIDKTRKLPITILARAMGFGSDQELLDFFGVKDSNEIISCLVIGYPDVKYQRTAPRKKADIEWI